jgi:hypothetical protein
MRESTCLLSILLAISGCGDGAPVAPKDDAATLSCPAGTDLDSELAACLLHCDAPYAAVLPVVTPGTRLTFRTTTNGAVEVGSSSALDALEPDAWQPGPDLVLDCQPPCSVKAFARLLDPACPDAPSFQQGYQVGASLAPAAGAPGSDAVPKDDTRVVGWATGWVDPIEFGTGIDDAKWKDPQKALGPAQGDTLDVLVLGNGGRAVLTFDPPFGDGPGPDLAVFENAFNDTFLELAFLEVSSDGEHFVRFDSLSLGLEPTASTVDPTSLAGLGGKYRAGFAVPFDLDWLRHQPLVTSGVVDLGAIRFVRVVDIVGDGSTLDSFGHPIYDPTPTTGTGGFDLDAVAVLRSGGQ